MDYKKKTDRRNNVENDRAGLLTKSDNQYGSLSRVSDSIEKRSESRCCCFRPWFVVELTEVFHLSWSLLLIQIFSFLMMPIALFFCGRLGDNELATLALVGSILEATVVSAATGLATASDTVFAQSFGSSNKSEYGVYLIKSIAIIMLFIFPTAALLMNLEPLLLLIGQPECVTRLTNDYLSIYMAAIPPIFLNQILMQYLRCQEILYPTVIIGGIGCGVCTLAHYIFVTVMSFGVSGSAFAMITAHYSVTVLLLVYIYFTKTYQKTWRGWTMDILQGWGMFVEMAIAGFFMSGLEWWAWEFGVFSAGLLGVKELGAASIILQIIIITYQVPVSIAIAVNIRVGYHLGAKQAAEAKHASYAGLFLITVTALIGNGIVIFASYELPKIFTDDPFVLSSAAERSRGARGKFIFGGPPYFNSWLNTVTIKLVGDVLPIGGLLELMDSYACLFGGIIRGCGRQLIGSIIMVISFYVCALPLAILMEFHLEMGLQGFYWSILIGIAVECVCFLIVLKRTDWDKMVYMAQMRAGVIEKRNSKNENERNAFDIEETRGSRAHIRPIMSYTSLKIKESSTILTRQQLICRRGLFVLAMVLVFVVGLVIKDQDFAVYAEADPCSNTSTASMSWTPLNSSIPRVPTLAEYYST